MHTLTLIAPFEVPEGQEEAFRQQWHDIVEPLSHAPGFLSARLYEVSSEVEDFVRRLPNMQWVGERRFRFVTIAEWSSHDHYEAAMRSHPEPKTISFPSYPAFYRLYGDFGTTAEAIRQREPETGQEFTFIIPFEVPEGMEEDMHRQWNDVITGMGQTEGKRVPGAIGPGLYEIDASDEEHLQNLFSARPGEGSVARGKFRFINVAGWASPAHYEAVLRSRQHARPISYRGHGAYYHITAVYPGSNQ